MQNEQLLEQVLALAGRGFSVFPIYAPMANGECACWQKECSRAGKHPRGKWTKLATTDAQKLRSMWSKYPAANVGIATGRQSNVVVIDIDNKSGKSGDNALAQLVEQHRALPETLTAITASGRHHYFRYPEVGPVRNGVSSLGDGIDVRGDGGYVVAPPSMHASHVRYTWADADAGIAEMPTWLLDLLTARADKPGPGQNTKEPACPADDEDVTIPEGTRNDTLFKLACIMRGHGKERQEIEAELLVVNENNCVPRLDQAEIRMIAAQVAKYPKGEPQVNKTSKAVKHSSASHKDPMQWFQFNVRWWEQNSVIKVMPPYDRGLFITLIVELWKNKGQLVYDDDLYRFVGAKSAEELQNLWWLRREFEITEDEAGEKILTHPLLTPLYKESSETYQRRVEQAKIAGRNSAKNRQRDSEMADNVVAIQNLGATIPAQEGQ